MSGDVELLVTIVGHVKFRISPHKLFLYFNILLTVILIVSVWIVFIVTQTATIETQIQINKLVR